ncbi:pyruvate ferredoxin oxidoreductase [Methanoculleus bourgensis]|jgi:pyruvate ferredoxin oxidoreductase beta subunit|uniref:Pyruvate ferredoxin oxidoreductase, beta subunit n=2 Tax=Methanoculleus bourgensis TaxID=83986 RepID=I7LLS7_METBM|nr:MULTISPECIES: thiamine pyrophosphate-dependent enzyme [Methanoculleus]MBT0733158.1 pyruvate ferredoxin oxidoreductase [Methanoculleus bourgensis]CCJ35614.1 pyruvate ferredoxin oxidoreductase, beta subunit [Methanoculleus bourgensis MS2]CVK32103.1 Pyruvate synthase subunit porB [Methanoculleus bourgensis]
MADVEQGCELFSAGHRACGGCGPALAARLLLKATGKNVIIAASTGCMEVFSTPYPETAWGVPWIHSLFENVAAVASGIEASLKKQGRSEKVVCIAGDGATFDIGVLCISGAFERGHDITYICYDNEAYMNTGIQRSGATPYGASTTTSPAGACAPGGNPLPKKDMPAILAAHGAPYVATASIAYPNDFIKKVERAINTPGPCYIQVHTPCCTGWGFESGETLAMAKLAIETGLWVNYEMVNGVVEKAKKVRRKPVEEYLAKQKRFRHLFRPARLDAEIAKIQAIADANAERFGIDIKVKEPSE